MDKKYYIIKNQSTGEVFSSRRNGDKENDKNKTPFLYATRKNAYSAIKNRKFLNRSVPVENRYEFDIIPVKLQLQAVNHLVFE